MLTWEENLHDKTDDFNVPIVNFPFICSNIPAAPTYGVYISQLIRYSRACSSYWLNWSHHFENFTAATMTSLTAM